MDAATLLAALTEAVPGAALQSVAAVDGHLTLVARREDLPALAPALRDRPDLRFALLAEVTAVDYQPREPRFEVVYILVSIEHRVRVRLRIPVPGDDPRLDTVAAVWPAANWLEREVWDMFGIVFDGHPDLRRLLMPDDWDGFPLRKDHPVQIRKDAGASEPLQVTAEEFRASVEKDRRARES